MMKIINRTSEKLGAILEKAIREANINWLGLIYHKRTTLVPRIG